jgi:hypothetical protein
MRFELVPIAALPRLAWAARVAPGDPVVRVLHGPWVETRDDGFVEGAWDAPFAEWDFAASENFGGSGAMVVPDGVLFASPANMYERLHAVRNAEALFVSNSLAFVLALSGERLDPSHRHYYLELLDHYRCGIRVKEKSLRLAGGRTVTLHDCCNLLVGRDARTTRHEKRWGPGPATYDDYAALLHGTVAALVANASDGARRHPYRPLAMVSQGYDSTAVAAIARAAGCREAVTFLRSHSEHGYVDDSGEAVAEALGLAVTAYERNDFERLPDHRAEEFYLEPWGVDRTMSVMARQLEGALLLSGRSAEAVWSRGGYRHWGLPDLQHPLNQTPGCALGELRLRTGFLHFAPATIAAVRHAPRIHRWNDGPELRPWSIGGDYDKPIARRIAEDAGVPRALFGQTKKGGADRPAHPGERTPAQRRVARIERSPRLRRVLRAIVGNRFHPRWTTGSFEVQAGCEKMIERYAAAIASRTPDDASEFERPTDD